MLKFRIWKLTKGLNKANKMMTKINKINES